MKLFEQFNFTSMLASIGLTIKGMITNPAFLLLSSSTVGFIQVFNYRKDLTIDLLVATAICFVTMTFLGLVKHYKSGEAKAEIFVKKTIEQFVVMVSVVLLGYIASIIIAVVFKIVTQAVAGANPVPGMALYFIFAGYGVMFTYYFIKSCDLIDQILPNLLPKWFSAPFRKFRQTGDYKDLLSFAKQEEETKTPVQ
jgi:hypothetical protein